MSDEQTIREALTRIVDLTPETGVAYESESDALLALDWLAARLAEADAEKLRFREALDAITAVRREVRYNTESECREIARAALHPDRAAHVHAFKETGEAL